MNKTFVYIYTNNLITLELSPSIYPLICMKDSTCNQCNISIVDSNDNLKCYSILLQRKYLGVR